MTGQTTPTTSATPRPPAGAAGLVGGARLAAAHGDRANTDGIYADHAYTDHAKSGPGDGPRAGFRADVEGLRAVAVTLVVLNHAGVAAVSGGYVGVDVFFVISGFVITMTLLREVERRGRISIAGFYARRASRLLPAATLVVLATLAASWLWLPPVRAREIAADALASTVYAINYRLALRGTDYFAAEASSPLQHFWSLAVEEQFYFVWPLLLFAVALPWYGRRRRLGPGGGARTGRTAAVLVVLTVLSFALGVWLTSRSAPWAYFAAPTRAWELALGALVAVGATRLARLPRRPAAVATWVGLAAVLASALIFDELTPFPGYAALLPVAGTALVIAAGCAAPRGGVELLLRTTAFQRIGALSYSWYLWHWPVLVIVPELLDTPPPLWQRLALAAGSLVLAVGCYALVENPIRRRPSLRARPWRAITIGGGLSAASAVIALLATQAPLAPAASGEAVDLAAALSVPASGRSLSPSAVAAAERRLAEAIAAGVYTQAVPSNLTPALASASKDLPVLYADRCDARLLETEVKAPCVYGDPTARDTVVLFGDSHAGHWFPALDDMAKRRHWRLVVVTKSICSAASTSIYLSRLKRQFHECDQWREQAMDRIRALRPTMVVMSSRGDGGKPVAEGDADQLWTDGWRTSIRRLAADGTRLVLISDTPLPKHNAPECVSAHPTAVHECSTPVRGAILKPKRRRMIEEVAARAGVAVVDPTAWFCTATTCPDVVGNVLVYKDASHMTTAYSRLLSPLLEHRIV